MTNKIFKESFAKPIKKVIKESEDVVKKAEKECFFEIVFKEKGDEEEKTEIYEDNFDDARADFLHMTQDDRDNYQYVVLRKVCTDYNSEEDIEVIDSFGLDESLKENKNSNIFYVEIDDNQNNAQAIIKITSAKTEEEACKKAKRLFIKWEDINYKTYKEYDMEEFVIEPKYIDKEYIVFDENGEEVDNPNKNESLKAEKEWSTDIQRADDYWANEVLFQAEALGIELKDGLEREIADKILNDDYIWEQIDSKIQELIEEINESCKKVSEAAGEQEKRTGHTEGNRLPELK